MCIPSTSISSTSTDSSAGQGCGCRQSSSGKTQVAIWSPSPQAPPICQAPALLLGPLLASGHPPPTLPVSSSSALSPSHFLPSFLSSSPANHLPLLPALPQSAPFPPFFKLLPAFLPQALIYSTRSAHHFPPLLSAPSETSLPHLLQEAVRAVKAPSTTKCLRHPSLPAPTLHEGLAPYGLHILLGIRNNQISKNSRSS